MATSMSTLNEDGKRTYSIEYAPPLDMEFRPIVLCFRAYDCRFYAFIYLNCCCGVFIAALSNITSKCDNHIS